MPEDNIDHVNFDDINAKAISSPLVKHMYTADPAVHVFENKIYIYPSHDINAGEAFDDLGSHFAMKDYHVFSMDHPDGEIADHGMVLHVDDVPWATQQMWDSDCCEKKGKYYLFFSAKDAAGIFRIGVAISDSPKGPFKAQAAAIENSFSIDPCVFKDNNSSYYIYFGGIWGGQLQRWREGKFNGQNHESPTAFLPLNKEAALCAKVAKLSDDLLNFEETPKDVVIKDENGIPIVQGDINRRFFEASWMHVYNGKYYFSYSTGDTHLICYAIGDNPYGPFTYAGVILEPVIGWTTHHSIVEFNSKWYLFYHDSILSKGVTHLRSIKVTELTYDANGFIHTIKPYK